MHLPRVQTHQRRTSINSEKPHVFREATKNVAFRNTCGFSLLRENVRVKIIIYHHFICFLHPLCQTCEYQKSQTSNSKDCGDLNIFKSPQSFNISFPIFPEIKLLALVSSLLLLEDPLQCFEEMVFPPLLRTQILFQGKIKLYP